MLPLRFYHKKKYQIQGYKPGCIQINNQQLTTSIIISASQLITHWPPQHINELTSTHLSPVLALQPSILLIGTGITLQFPALETYGDLINHGIGIEIMDTAAACRTYNALTAENRQVAAALILR